MPAGARPGHLHALLLALERLAAGQQSEVGAAAASAGRGARQAQPGRRDFRSAGRSRNRSCAVCGTSGLAARDVIVFQLLDPDELTFPFSGASRFRDLESAAEVIADPARCAPAYLRELAEPDADATTASCAATASTTCSSIRRSRSTSRCWPTCRRARGGSERHGLPLPSLPRRSGRRGAADRAALPAARGRARRAVQRRATAAGRSPVPAAEQRRLRDLLLLAARVLAL